jgi:hypothetical protein
VIHEAGVSRVPLPRNITSRDELSRLDDGFGFSLFDVPERPVAPTFVATVPNCRVLAVPDEWGDRHYVILTEGRQLRVRGTGYEPKLHAPLMKAKPAQRLARASWILELWDQNYSHWLTYHLVKVVLLQRVGLADTIIRPGVHKLAPLVRRSMERLGLSFDELPVLQSNVLDVDELTVVGMDHYCAPLLEEVRARFIGADPPPPHRKLFISRRKAQWRHLANEDECWRTLESFGYERVSMEELDFEQQVSLMREAVAVFTLQGSGIANVLFAQRGLHLIEVSDVTLPTPIYYALSAALGHHHWLLEARPHGAIRRAYHDLVVDAGDVRAIVERVENALFR